MAFDLTSVLKDVPEVGTGREQIEYLRLDQLVSDANNFYQLSKIDDLAANIQLCGLQQPIRVRKCSDKPNSYTIVSGHRRRAAIELLAMDEPEKWTEVPCIVEQDEASPALQQLRLIYANANTRVMLPAEISEQAVQVEKLLYQLKEEGYSFPGRMRDHVAQAVNVSKSKLSRLKVIRDNLAPCWQDAWEKSELTESTAYTLAQMNQFWQQLIFDGRGEEPKYLYESTVSSLREKMDRIDALECPYQKTGSCINKVRMMQRTIPDRLGEPCRRGCCMKCDNLRSCKYSCPSADAKKKELKLQAREEKQAQEQNREEKEKPILDFIQKTYSRLAQARTTAGKSVEDVFALQKKFYSVKAAETFEALEQGSGKPTVNTDMPFGYCLTASSLMTICAVADGLGCSIDYLFGRTDVMEMAQREQPVPTVGTMWHPISEEPPMDVDLVWADCYGHADVGKYWGNQKISVSCTVEYDEARWWAYLPKEEK